MEEIKNAIDDETVIKLLENALQRNDLKVIGGIVLQHPEIVANILRNLVMFSQDNEARMHDVVEQSNMNFNRVEKVINFLKLKVAKLEQENNEMKLILLDIHDFMNSKGQKNDMPVCNCGHVSGDHSGTGKCLHCDCGVFEEKKR